MPESAEFPSKNRAAIQRRFNAGYVRFFVIAAVTCVAFGFAIRVVDFGLVWNVAKQISVETVLVVGALLLLGALLAAIRFWFMASDLGHGLSARDALLALSVGQIAGAITVQYFGQIAARSMLLGSRGLSPPANIVLATYERFIAAAVSAAMAVTGAWYLFGRVALNLQTGGDQFIKILLGIAVAAVAGGVFGWGSRALDAVRGRLTKTKIAGSIARSICLTLAIQICTVTAYVVAAHSLAPNIAIMELVAASVVVAFIASLPISFAGWGVRELSAVLALGSIGVRNETALTIAMLVGAVAMVVVIVIAIAATILPQARSSIDSGSVDGPGYAELVGAVKFAVPLLAAMAVFFQVFVPIGNTLVNVNLADPVAILGGSLFALYAISAGAPRWRLTWLNGHVAIATAVMIGAFLHGLYLFGWNDWAFTNKLLGWLVLLAYGATGALIVSVSDQGMKVLVRTFVGVAVGIVLLELFFVAVNSLGFPLSGVFSLWPIEGFSQNRNAFAFVLLLSICGSVLITDRTQGWVLGILLTGMWLGGSRAGFGALGAILIMALFIRALSIRNLLFGFGVAAGVLAAIALLPFVGAYLFSLDTYLFSLDRSTAYDLLAFRMTQVSSDTERFRSITDGIGLFLSNPVFGSGLGAYAAGKTHGNFVVIHSTSVWLLAEMGVIGLLAFAVPAVRVFWSEYTSAIRDRVGQMLLLILVTFAVMSLVHELLYQRALWLLLGAGLACIPPGMEPKNGSKAG